MKRSVTLAGLCIMICALAVPGLAFGQVKSGAVELSPMAGCYLFDDDQIYEDNPVYTLGAGYHFTEKWAAELTGGYIDAAEEAHGVFDESDADGWLVRLDALYHFMPEKRFVPYLAAGVGNISVTGGNDSYHSHLVDYGAGVKWFLTDSIALRGDARHLYCFDERFNNFAFTAGATFQFGGGKEKVRKTAASELTDSDGDGVYDYLDQCPETPGGAEVDQFGCPVEAEEAATEAVEEAPAPAETEEAVPEYEQPAEEAMDFEGCEAITVQDDGSIEMVIQFEFDKSDIKGAYHMCLEYVAEFMKQNPEVDAVIEGHTCNIGSKAYNEGLSKRRAMSVKHYLVDNFQVEGGRLETRWFGETRPTADNSTEAGRVKNRRAVTITAAPAM